MWSRDMIIEVGGERLSNLKIELEGGVVRKTLVAKEIILDGYFQATQFVLLKVVILDSDYGFVFGRTIYSYDNN